MSELRENVHKNDFLMDKGTKQLHFVIKIDMHHVWARVEADGDDVELKKIPKHFVNKFMIKVNPDVMKVLYGPKEGNLSPEHIPDLPKNDSSE